jgi:hypothetical protein
VAVENIRGTAVNEENQSSRGGRPQAWSKDSWQPVENDNLRLKELCRDVDCFQVRTQLRFKHRLLDLHLKSMHIPATMINATPTQLRKAADIQERIESLQEELGQLLGGEVSTPAQATEAPKKRKFSAAAKARMRAAQQARWAKIKGTAPSAKPVKKAKRTMSAQGLANILAGVAKRMAAQGKAVQKPKRKVSAAGRAAISAAAKLRWAKAKKAGKSRL